MNVNVAAISVVAVLCAFCVICGCTDYGEATEMSLVVLPAEPTLTPVIAEDVEEWSVWREGSVSIGRLGGYQSFKPSKNGDYFQALRVEVDASGPVTLLFLTPDELVNFKTKMMTNAGDYYPVVRYCDVTSGIYTREGDDDLAIAILNEENKPVTAGVNIWYHI
ncbi:hypothetical protein L0665_06235 [Methanogenium marinum]|uniref:Uncharacterized protein n=1 Tax=Methanogenium marinum TaxID=348610 RepID=A0A9Q4KT49_9EURY|nr:hypothetical protein [Methanogenium marinum]MDE4908206.1 hypothetical protein [Methanogenium marinum]